MTTQPSSTAESPTSSGETELALRTRIETMTDAQLDHLLKDIEGKNHVVEQLRQRETQAALEKRMDEVQVKQEVRNRWQMLKETLAISSMSPDAAEKAEQSFLQKMAEKGGPWAALTGVGIAILAWLGFSKAKELHKSIREKGFLRTAAEGAKKHPIFTAFIGILGIKAGTDYYHYLEENAGPITQTIQEKAKEAGVSAVDMASTLAEKIRVIIGSGLEKGLVGSIKGLTYVLNGKYDEETGVITLGQNILKSPTLIAYQSGVRRRAGDAALDVMVKSSFSRFLVETRLSSILNETGKGASLSSDKKLLAQRGLALLNKPTLDAAGKAEVERILGTLAPDMDLGGRALRQVQASPDDAKKHLEDIEKQMKTQSGQEVEEFNRVKHEIENEMLRAEEDLKAGKKFSGGPEEYKRQVAAKVNKRMQEFRDEMAAKKIALGSEYERALNAMAAGGLEEHVRYQLDTATNGKTFSRGLEKSTQAVESLGFKMMKVPGGKYVFRAMIGYSFLPLIMEGAAGLRSGEEGVAARQAFLVDATDAGIGFIPVVGELNDFRAAVMGTDLNGRELNFWSRVTSGTMGTLGTAAIVAGFFTGGTSIAGFKILRGAVMGGRALDAARLADAGVTTASVTSKGLKAMDATTDSTKAIDTMYSVTQSQKIARNALNTVRNAQRTMQCVTYSMLGYSMYSGVTEMWNATGGIVNYAQEQGLKAVDTAEKYISGKAATITQ